MAEIQNPPRRWLRPPQLRTVASEGGERHASWLELFFDLVLVVAIAQLAHLFAHHPDWHGALVAGGLFVAVFLAWQGFSFYADRFDSDDLPFRLATFGQMLALLALGVQARDVAEGHHAGFAIAFAIFRGILVAQYLRAYLHVPAARPLIRRYGGVYAVSVVLWLISALLPEGWWVLWTFALALDLSVVPLSTSLHRSIPTDPAHVPERFGLFTLIVLGEMVVTVAIGTMEATWSPGVVAVAVAGFGIAACLWWLYFERLQGQELPRAAAPIVIFAYVHLPLLAALMFIAGAVSILVHAHEAAAISAGAWALGVGGAVFLAALNVAHRQLVAPLAPAVHRARWIAAALMLVIPLVAQSPLAASAAALAVLVALLTIEGIMCAPAQHAEEHRSAAREVH